MGSKEVRMTMSCLTLEQWVGSGQVDMKTWMKIATKQSRKKTDQPVGYSVHARISPIW